MKIEKTEYSYHVTECDLKFGEQITLDGELLIPVSVLDKIRADIEFEVDHRTNMLCAEDVFAILDKYKAEKQDVMPKVYNREIADVLADVIEDFLESKGVEIPNPEKDENNNAAILYGSDYSEITDSIMQTLRNFGIDVRDTYNLEEDLEEDYER